MANYFSSLVRLPAHTQNLITTSSQVWLLRMQISAYWKHTHTHTYTVRSVLDYSHASILCINYATPHELNRSQQERTLFRGRACVGLGLDGDIQEVSYHGHFIDVLLTKQ